MRIRAYLLFSILLLAGCSALKPGIKTREAGPLAEPRSIRAEATVGIRKKMLVLTGRATVLAKGPDLFRIEVLGPFSQVMALMVSDGKGLYIFSGKDTKYYEWTDPKLPYPFNAREAVSFLLGTDRFERINDDYRISRDELGRVTKVIKFKDGTPYLTVSMSDYRDISGSYIPFNIVVDGKKEGMEINYSTVEINPEIDTGLFSITPDFQ